MPQPRAAKKPGVVIDVPGISADTLVGDLTVEQLVLVIHGVVSQTSTAPRALSPAQLELVAEQIRAMLAPVTGKQPSAIHQGIADMQSAILAQIPDIARETAAARGPARPAGRRRSAR
jgi:hypothetical protein